MRALDPARPATMFLVRKPNYAAIEVVVGEKGGDGPVARFGALAAILACCGVKLVVLAALLAPAGFLTGEIGFAIGGLVLAGVLIVWAVRRRHRCDGTCHVPESPRHERVPAEH
jgi:hypothetical protein